MVGRRLLVVVTLALISCALAASCGGGGEDAKDQSERDNANMYLNNDDEANRLAIEKANQVNVGPQLQFTAPPTGSAVAQSPLLIEWTATDESADKPTIEVSIKNVDTGVSSVIMPAAPDPGKFEWSGWASQHKGDYEIALKGIDAKGLSNTVFCRIKKP